MNPDRHSNPNSASAFPGALGRALARFVLLAFVVVIAIFNTKDTLWPAVSWPMFSSRKPQYPGEFYEANVILAFDVHGNTRWIRTVDLWGIDRYQIGLRLISGSVSVTDPRIAKHRRALIDCIRIRYPDFETQHVEIRKLTWKLDLDAEHTLDFDRPHESLLLASFGDELTGAVSSQEVTP